MKRIFLTCCLGGCVFIASAQSVDQMVVSSGGGHFETSQSSLSGTIGEPITETFATDSLQLTQGFHQSYFQIVSVQETPGFSIGVNVYPNPAIEYFQVALDAPDFYAFEYVLHDLNGRVLQRGSFQSNLQQIPLMNLENALYLFTISNPNYGYSKTYQIQKIK